MKNSLFLIAAVGLLPLAATFYSPDTMTTKACHLTVSTEVSKPGDLVVHEWGTFTSIAGKNGVALDWRPLNGASDLPKFVYSETTGKGRRGTYGLKGKGQIARIRMETPVIYFYTKEEMEVDVGVEFPKGTVTEWYPHASVVNPSGKDGENVVYPFSNLGTGITWGKIKLLPNENPRFKQEASASHYYAARETDSTPVRVCYADKTSFQYEKFLFYRGIGNFDLPLKVRLDGDNVVLGLTDAKYSEKSDPIRKLTNVIVFENRGGRIGYTFVPSLTRDTPVERPQLTRSLDTVYAELENALVLRGLYPKEARAMIETWKDSWFEEGLRVFYIMPRAMTDEVLRLWVEPTPKETVRVLVGRAEVITPQMETAVRQQVSLLSSPSPAKRRSARADLKRNGRFYEPILKTVLEDETDPGVRNQIQRLIALK